MDIDSMLETVDASRAIVETCGEARYPAPEEHVRMSSVARQT